MDEYKAFNFCAEAQNYYKRTQAKTQVLAASLTSVAEVMQLAGVQHITISPPLLRELATTPADSWNTSAASVFSSSTGDSSRTKDNFRDIINDEGAWRLAFARSGFGTSHAKIIQAINYFSDFQDKLEEMMLNYI